MGRFSAQVLVEVSLKKIDSAPSVDIRIECHVLPLELCLASLILG